MKSDSYLMLFANIIPVKGFKQSILLDLQFGSVKIIPNSLLVFINELENTSISTIQTKYSEQSVIIKQYFDFILKNEYGYIINESERKLFPELSLNWDIPTIIGNAIVDVSNNNINLIDLILEQLDELNCFHVQFRIFEYISFEKFIYIAEIIRTKAFLRISLIIDNNLFLDIYDNEAFNNLLTLSTIIIYNCENDSIENKNDIAYIYSTKNIIGAGNCGNISQKYFSINLPTFTESQHHNTCLNRKICIDVNGEIKNCPSMKKSFGNIKDITLKEALEKPDFKDLWFICKDQIDVCQDCEFRHICTDCRAFIKDPENIYSQPAKCTYNPYIAKWQGQEGYITVEQWREETKNIE